MKVNFLLILNIFLSSNVYSQSFDSTYYQYLKGIVYENKAYDILDVIPKTEVQYSIFYNADGLSIDRFFELQQEVDEHCVQTKDTLYVQYYLLLGEYADGYVADVYFGWLERAYVENPLVKEVLCTRIKRKNAYVFKRLSYLLDDIKKEDE
jgi:hypothetical protein